MQIATYVDGRGIDYDDATKQLSCGGAALGNEHVLGYDRAGQLAWISPEMRSWFYQQAGVPLTAAPAAPPVKKKKKTGLIIGIVIGVLLLCGIGSVLSSGDDDGASTTENVATQGADAENTEAEAPAMPKVGEMYTTEQFEITIVSVDTKEKVGSEFFESTPADGGEYVAIRWKYKNISKKPIGMFSTPSLKLLNPDGVEFGSDVGASSSYATELDLTEKIISDLNPGITVEGAGVFEVEKGSFDRGAWEVLVDADEDVTFALE
ncbi:MAG: DUF4352 domain-containing protein [Coriobacteriia bacterium]|nr:DUF4352 domain-containing protein [Coriobacteriia bacterium]